MCVETKRGNGETVERRVATVDGANKKTNSLRFLLGFVQNKNATLMVSIILRLLIYRVVVSRCGCAGASAGLCGQGGGGRIMWVLIFVVSSLQFPG